MATIEDFVSGVRPHVISCPEPSIQDAVRTTLREFMTRTCVFIEPYEFTARAGTNPYGVYLNSGMEPFSVMSLFVDDVQVPGLRVIATANVGASGRIKGYTFDGGDLTLLDTPSADHECRAMVVAVTPYNVRVIPDVIHHNYRDAIVDGAVYRLASMENTSWFAPTVASMALNRYNTAVVTGKQRMASGYHAHAAPRVNLPSF